MTARKLVNTKNISRDLWHWWRKQGIGGSDISAILGFNNYKNEVSVWLEKTGQIDPVEENFKMKMGNMLEPIVADLFAEEHPELKIKRNHFLLQHSKIDCMTANIDREIICPVRGRGILEIKTTGEFSKKEWTSETVPDMYMFQIQHYFAVTGYKFGYFAVLIGGNTEYKSYLVERDDGIIAFIEAQAVQFWDKVVNNEMPVLDGSEASREALSVIYPHENAKAETIELPFHLMAMMEELQEIKKKETELDERKRFLQAQIITDLGNNTIGRVGNYYVTWKPQTRNTVDSKLLKEKFPDVHAAVLKQGQSRPFLLGYKEE